MDGRTYAPNEWGDPDSLRDILPQPFRFIDRCVPVPVTPCSSRCATVPQAHQTACFPLNVPKDTMGLAIDMRGLFRIQPELAVHTARPDLRCTERARRCFCAQLPARDRGDRHRHRLRHRRETTARLDFALSVAVHR